ncbi:auxin-responsive protein IAA2 isoform X2 [Ricinus communis]|uniref:auxin-responsive protein IAA2 isoform X2 n=1 Tax=Ricinus communis TaxID=3988 RepID=UPI00077243E8|nr:auxin-responsive protein IAA2 isoform X2 [Ricinus communis]|eukprot:XP_015573097.1 auxin-responsive protein IAA2 isoform X1 [Ricinus communis]
MEEYTEFSNLIPEEGKWQNSHKATEEKKLELRLGPPGEFLGFHKVTSLTSGSKRVLDDQDSFEGKTGEKNWLSNRHEMQCKKFSWSSSSSSSSCACSLRSSTFQREGKNKEIQEQPKGTSSSSSSYLQCSTVVELHCPDKKKACSGHPSASFPAAAAASTRDGTSGSHERVAPSAAPLVGWPPIRSFRKHLGSSNNSKLASDLPDKNPTGGFNLKPESFRNGLFVKINMEGIPIGRKINLNAYDSYEKLSIAIDELFSGLLAAQRETSAARNINRIDEAKAAAGSSSGVGNGEYTLVYEDSEGDRILVGDVPWHMFVSTAKRLRVLKSSELSSSRIAVGSGEEDKADKTPLNSVVEIERRRRRRRG